MSEQASDGEQQACTPALPHNGSAAKAIGLPPTAPLACPTHAPGFPGVGWSATHTHTHTHTHIAPAGSPLGQPLPIFSTARHLAKRAPCS